MLDPNKIIMDDEDAIRAEVTHYEWKDVSHALPEEEDIVCVNSPTTVPPRAVAVFESGRFLNCQTLEEILGIAFWCHAVGCPVEGCKSRVPRFELVRGVCKKCAGCFETKHADHMNGVEEESEAEPTTGEKLNGHFGEHSEFVKSTDDPESGEGFMLRLAFETGVQIETVTYIAAKTSNQYGTGSVGAEAGREFLLRMKAGMAWLIGYTGDKVMAERCLCYKLGFLDMAESAVEIALKCSTDKHRVQKATVNKCLRNLESYLNSAMPQFEKLPPSPGQRSDEARENMSKVTAENWRA